MVTVSTRNAVSPALAGSSVSVFTRGQLDTLGLYTLQQAAELSPGYHSYPIYGEWVLTSRGLKAGSFENNKHLLLIDGIPFVHARAGKVPIEAEMPLPFYSQVEFLRGPASALYGSGAFYGTIQLVSPEPPWARSQGWIQAGLGSEAGAFRTAAQITHADPQVGLTYANLSASLWPDTGQRAGSGTDPRDEFRDWQDAYFVHLGHRLTHGAARGLEVGYILSDKAGGMGEGFLNGHFTSPLNRLQWRTQQPFVRYRRDLNETLSLDTHLRYNLSEEIGQVAPYTRATYPGPGPADEVYSSYHVWVDQYAGAASLSWQIQPELNLRTGVEADQRLTNQDSFNFREPIGAANTRFRHREIVVEQAGAYTQADYQSTWRLPLHAVAGLRYDYSQSGDFNSDQLSPRCGLVQALHARWFLFAQYATALRAPGPKEYGLNGEVQRGNQTLTIPTVESEVFQSWEAGIRYAHGRTALDITYFHQRVEDAIISVRMDNSTYLGNDEGVTHSDGIDLAASHGFNDTLGVRLGWTRALSETPAGVPLVDIPANVAYASLLLTPPGFPLSGSTTVRASGPYNGAQAATPASEAAYFVDLTANYAFNTTWGLQLSLRNLLGTDFRYPKNGAPETPAQGTTLWLTLKAGF